MPPARPVRPGEFWHDGNWCWSRGAWVSTLRTVPADALLSDDRTQWWSGRDWRTLPRPSFGLQRPPFTPGDVPPLRGARVNATEGSAPGDADAPLVIAPAPVTRRLALAILLLAAGGALVWLYVVFGVEFLLIPLILPGLGLLLLAGVLGRIVRPAMTLRLTGDGILARRRSQEWRIPWAAAGPFLTDGTNRRLLVALQPATAWPDHRTVDGTRYAVIETRWFATSADHVAAVLNERRDAACADSA